mgnify:CR=1 FL=1
MNKIVLISSYCDTEEKINILNKNIDTIKSLGLDIMLNSPIILPLELITKCDYFFLTKDNPVFTWPERALYTWRKLLYNNKTITLTRCFSDYSWAGLYQVKKLSEIALTFDYDIFYHIIYDLKIDDVVIDGFNSNDKKCNFYHFHEHETSLHFMIFDRFHLLQFLPFLTAENYLSNGGIVENWLINLLLLNNFEYTLEDSYVNDLVLYNSGDIFNYSKFDKFSYFIQNAPNENIKLFFYNVQENLINIKIGDIISEHLIFNGKIIDLGYKNDNIIDTLILHNNEIFNITEDIRNIINNNIVEEKNF